MFSPTRAFPNPVLPVTNLGGVLNRISYGAFLRLPTAPYHRTINRWRKETLKLPPTSLLASELDVRGRPIQGWSAAVPMWFRPLRLGRVHFRNGVLVLG